MGVISQIETIFYTIFLDLVNSKVIFMCQLHVLRVSRWFFFSLVSLGLALPLYAVRPMYHSIALVAGAGTSGFRDGSFTSALFNNPLGLAIRTDGTILYVADGGNNRIRAIHLDQDNLVTTLTGQNTPGSLNGPVATATFNQPRGLLYLPGDRLVVNDAGNNRLRLVDLKTGTVTTLAGGSSANLDEGPSTLVAMDGIQDMAYVPDADSIFFTQPGRRAFKK